MENSLKQRIVGAVVLIALAVIFLPAVLKEKTEQKTFESQIPAKPIELDKYQVDAETIAKNKQLSEKLDEIENAAESETENSVIEDEADTELAKNNLAKSESAKSELAKFKSAETSEKVSSDPTKQPKQKAPAQSKQPIDDKQQIKETLGEAFKEAAWVIKVASFSNLDNARKMIAQLKQKGYKAYRRSGKNQQGKTVYRIYVGPYIEKSRASSQLDAVSALSQSKAMLMVFDPTKH